YAKGPDGKADTKDDVELGLVDALWTIEEFAATFKDDDKDFVGEIDAETGLFTPNVDGPNPKRKNNANNYGDVWVVAAYPRNPGRDSASTARPVKRRAHLLVSVPSYIMFDQPEVARSSLWRRVSSICSRRRGEISCIWSRALRSSRS